MQRLTLCLDGVELYGSHHLEMGGRQAVGEDESRLDLTVVLRSL